MTSLEIHLFGNVRVNATDSSSTLRMTHISQALFAYLVLNRHQTLSRESLADLFWSESSQEKARSSLGTALWRLRRALEPNADTSWSSYLVTTPGGDVGFNCDSDYWLDIEAFEITMDRALDCSAGEIDDSQVHDLEQALKFYSRELMEGFYDDWVLRERERIRTLYITGQLRLIEYYQRRGDYERSIYHAQQILQSDPLREEIHRHLMRLYVQSGQRPRALRQYEVCQATLKEEMGIPPMSETQALYAQIAASAGPNDPHPEIAALNQAIHKLNMAAQQLEEVRQYLSQALQMMDSPPDLAP